MEIIKHGVEPTSKHKEYEWECYWCDTEFKFTGNELLKTGRPDDTAKYTINCPTCKKELTILED